MHDKHLVPFDNLHQNPGSPSARCTCSTLTCDSVVSHFASLAPSPPTWPFPTATETSQCPFCVVSKWPASWHHTLGEAGDTHGRRWMESGNIKKPEINEQGWDPWENQSLDCKWQGHCSEGLTWRHLLLPHPKSQTLIYLIINVPFLAFERLAWFLH